MNKLLTFIFLGLCTSAMAAGPMLISTEEMLASNNAAASFRPKIAAPKDAPLIELSAPKLSAPVASPTAIELKFQPTPPSAVKPNTFKVLYGAFEIDITKRILSVAKVTEAGVLVQEASLPKGKHKLLMVVEDTAGRQGSKLIEFEVN
jgi:hypothetical protein